MARGIFEIDTIRDDSGNVISVDGATIEVRDEATGALAATYAAITGGSALTNPRTLSAGVKTILFYIEESIKFRITITKGAYERTLRYRVAQSAASSLATWEPTIAFVTPGNSVFSDTSFTAQYQRVDSVVMIRLVATFTPTIGTASGALEVSGPSGLSPASQVPISVYIQTGNQHITWPSGRTSMTGIVTASGMFRVDFSGDGVLREVLSASHMTTEQIYQIRWSGMYIL